MNSQNGCVGGDGGPLIVLQASAVSQWQGASDFDHSLMNGGSIETDYDIICNCAHEIDVVTRYDRDILVLWDSEWGAHIFPQPNGDIFIIQGCWEAEDMLDFPDLSNLGTARRSFPIQIQDTSVRLLVGADGGAGETWQYYDAPVSPGAKQVEIYVAGTSYALRICTA